LALQALAECSQLRREKEHQADLIQVLHKERDQALATLKKHGLIIDRNIEVGALKENDAMCVIFSLVQVEADVPASAADQIEELQEQNENLRHVIRQMREEIERIEEGHGITKASSVAEGM
jgi:hypothetical protein